MSDPIPHVTFELVTLFPSYSTDSCAPASSVARSPAASSPSSGRTHVILLLAGTGPWTTRPTGEDRE